MERKIHVGTSGWHYKHWVGTFYPEGIPAGDQLGHYLRDFAAVEINNSFYRVPQAKTFEEWNRAVPEAFIFAVKANRFFTHLKKLKVEKADVENFIDKVDRLGKKAGPILFQLPPNWKINVERLEEFLCKLPSHHRYTFEFRNSTWYQDDVYECLGRFNAAFCIYELAGHHSPLWVTADFVYTRLHGPGDKYQGSYSNEQLQEWASQCLQWQQTGKEVYVFFDNDEKGYAAHNARQLSKVLHLRRSV